MDALWNLDENNPGAVGLGAGAHPEADAEQTAAAAEEDDQGPSPVPPGFWVPLRECPHYTPADPEFDQLDLFAKAPPDLLLCVLAQLWSAQHLCSDTRQPHEGSLSLRNQSFLEIPGPDFINHKSTVRVRL